MTVAMQVGIVAFAFGAPETLWSNGRIAAETWEASRDYQAPIFTQSDVLIKVPPKGSEGLEYIVQRKRRKPSTLEIARWAAYRAKQKGIDHLLVVAAFPHLERCLRDLRFAVDELGGGIRVVPYKGVYAYAPALWFRRDSLQWRTRYGWRWNATERLLMDLPMAVYVRIAG